MLIGVLSAVYDKDFANLILSEGYVNMTIENIKNGNAVGVYQDGSTWGSTIGITFNNIIVGAKLYIYGIFGGLGTLYLLMQNSVMVGTFQYFFYEHGALGDSARGIWLHGAFEIFSMVVEGMCGLILGTSILFPKTLSRFNSFKNGFKNSFKIFLSTVPFTICAGIIEGYVTRHALNMPLSLNLFIIFGCLGIIGFYYFIYPHIVNRRVKNLINDAVL